MHSFLYRFLSLAQPAAVLLFNDTPARLRPAVLPASWRQRAFLMLMTMALGLASTHLSVAQVTIGATTYPTIQAAINAAANGDVINVAAGTYTEQLIIDNKTITIQGTGTPTIKAPAGALAIGGPVEGGGYDKQNIVEIKGGSAVTISGVTIRGTVDGTLGCGTDAFGIYVHDNATLKLTNSFILDARLTDPGLFGCQVGFGIGIGLTGSPASATLTNVTISGYQKGGILARGAGTNLVAASVTVTGTGPTTVIGQNGIQVSSGATATITNSTIQNNNYTPPANDNTTASGIIVYDSGPVTITGTSFSGNDVGLDAGGTSTVTANDNTFTTSDAGNFAIYPPATASGNTVVQSVTNVTTGVIYSAIQFAVNEASAGNVLNVSAGTFNEQVLVNKSLTITGVGSPKPIINFTGTPALASGHLTLFDVTAPDVTIQNLTFTPDLTKVGSAILASVALPGSVSALTVSNNNINPYRSGAYGPAYGRRNAISINYGEYRVSSSAPRNLSISGNTIVYDDNGTPANSNDDTGFRAGIAVDEGGGSFAGNTIQSINQDIQVRFGLAGAISVTNNNINGGGVELAEQNGAAGPMTVTGNTFNGTFGNTFTSSLRLKNNTSALLTTVNNNTFTGHNQGVSLENYQAVAVNNNTFTPATGSTTYRHVTVDTKEFSSSSGSTAPVVSLTLLGNTFTGSSSPTSGTALVFYNQDNDNPALGPFVIGTVGNENTFSASLGTFIALDGSTGAVAPNATPAAPFAVNIDIRNNKFDVGSGLKLPADLTASERATLEAKLLHKPDNAALGRLSYFFPVQNVTQNKFYETIQLAVDAATAGDVLLAPAGTYPESVTINKAITLNGAQAGVDPRATGAAARSGGESVVTTPVNNTANGNLFTVRADNVIIDGFTFDGDNTSIAGGLSANGADINVGRAISSGDDASFNTFLNGLTVRNNIIKNIARFGVTLYVPLGTQPPNLATINALVTKNAFDNVRSYGVYAEGNQYVSVVDNKMTRMQSGMGIFNIGTQYAGSGTPQITGNDVESAGTGLYYNNFFGAGPPAVGVATPFNVANNTFRSIGTTNVGLRLYSLFFSGHTFTNNTSIGTNYGAFIWSTPGAPVISGGSLEGLTAAVRLTNRVAAFNTTITGSNGSAVVSSVAIANSPIGVQAFDDPGDTQNAGVVSLTVTGNTNITGTGAYTAVAVSGADASAAVLNNAASFVGNGTGVGVDINGGSATVRANSITNFGVGINVANGGKLGTTVNNFLTNNQTTGIRFAADAATTGQGPVNDNSITTTATGTGRAIQNASGAAIAATCNWLGSTTGLSPAYVQNTGVGSLTYTPTRIGGTDDATGPSNGFQPQDACVCPAPTVVASATGVCAGNSVTLTASGAASYTWSTGESTASIVVTPTSLTTITLNATNEGGCVSTTAVTIAVNNAPTNASLTSGTLTCTNTSVTLTASATGGTSYTLNGGTGSQTNMTGQFVVSTAGNYTVVIANASNCTATATATVTSNTGAPAATLMASSMTACAPASITLTAGTTGVTGYTFSAGATQIGMSNQAVVTQSGSYSVTVSGANGCTATASVSVTISTPPAAPTLTGVSRTVIQSTTPLPLTQFVNAANGNTLSFSGVNGVLNPPNADISQPGVQSFSVTQTDTRSCVSLPTPFTITVTPPSPGNQSVCRSSTVVLNATTTGVRYEWYKNGTSIPFKLTEIASIQKGTATSSLTLVSIQTTASYYVKVFQANGSFVFDGPFKVTVDYSCIAPGARAAAAAVVEVPLSVTLMPNPVVDGQLRAVVTGAGNQPLTIQLLDLRGRVVREQSWPLADETQLVEWDVRSQATGTYLLSAEAAGQKRTIKVLKAD